MILDRKFGSLQQFVLWAINSEDPSIVGLAILCVSVSIQQLDTGEHESLLRRLPYPPGELVHEYFSHVEALIVNDTSYASTIEGISVILMSAKTLMNFGAIKKTVRISNSKFPYLLVFTRPVLKIFARFSCFTRLAPLPSLFRNLLTARSSSGSFNTKRYPIANFLVFTDLSGFVRKKPKRRFVNDIRRGSLLVAQMFTSACYWASHMLPIVEQSLPAFMGNQEPSQYSAATS